jgi:hypothetical protein
LRGIETGGLETAVVPAQQLGLAVFEKELAIVAALQGIVEQSLDATAVEVMALEEELLGGRRIGHGGAPFGRQHSSAGRRCQIL